MTALLADIDCQLREIARLEAPRLTKTDWLVAYLCVVGLNAFEAKMRRLRSERFTADDYVLMLFLCAAANRLM